MSSSPVGKGSRVTRWDLLDPVTERFAEVSHHMLSARAMHTATKLLNGEVLITGGVAKTGSEAMRGAELFDPILRRFKQVGQMSSAREQHTATLLSNPPCS